MSRAGSHRTVAGRRIRWANAGKAAAIVAAVLAALASLPSLLGGEEPPPLPPDVGIGQVSPAAPPAPVTPATPPTPPAKPGPAGKLTRGRAPGKRRRDGAGREARPDNVEKKGREGKGDGAPAYVPTVAYAPSYPAPAPAAPRERFDIER